MAKKFLVPIDLNKLELQNPVFQNLGAAPGTPATGQFYFDTNGAANIPTFYNGSAWVQFATRTANTYTGKQTLPAVSGSVSGSLNIPAGSGNTPVSGDLYNIGGALMFHNGAAKTIAYTDSAMTGNTSGSAATLSATLGPALGGTGVANNAANTITFTGNYSLGITLTGNTSVTFPTSGTLANTAYVDSAVAGLSWKDEVRVATTAAGTLATSFANGQTVDGVVLATNDRILIKDQAAGAENGLYIVQAAGAPVRSTDADSESDITGMAVTVKFGTTNAGNRYVLTTSGTITLGTTALVYALFSSGSAYSAGNGLTLSSTTFHVGAGTGITVNADDVAIDTSVVVRKFSQATHASATSVAVTHNLNTRNITACVYDNSTWAEVECDVVHTDANNCTFSFAVAPSANAYSFVIHG